MIQLIQGFLIANPTIAAILTSIGALRLFLKPIQVMIQMTPTKKDDEIMEKVMESKAWKVFRFALDYFASIKVAPKTPKAK